MIGQLRPEFDERIAGDEIEVEGAVTPTHHRPVEVIITEDNIIKYALAGYIFTSRISALHQHSCAYFNL